MNSSDNHFKGNFDANTLTVIICSGLAFYNALELELLILTTFHAYRGLYFWSLVTASFGIIPYVLGYSIKYFKAQWMAPAIAIDTFGWILMVTGQSVVLYSRLWLLFGSGHRKLLAIIKWMIIVDAICFHGTTAVVVYGASYGKQKDTFGLAYNYVERIQMVGFCLQEFVLSGLYIWKALDIIKSSDRKRSRRLMWQLLSINVIIILLDIGLLTVEFLSLHVLQQTIKGLTYSVKLKLELAVLNKLVELSSINRRADVISFGDPNDFVDTTKTSSISKIPAPALSRSMYTYPKWMYDLEKSSIQSIETKYLCSDATRPPNEVCSVAPSDILELPCETIQPVSTSLDPRSTRRERGSATDLMYADAVRRIAS
ncbi:hypothetical protein M011DRAFT_393842 [Sporormia fimetaria CBS 119925]|uniref:DUF7703 domain-containing protein n=1 Tax=Sporormia fimetaria CBS 119925 TaxID=1340428 RepID=A0A6A6VME3_9PLEO|nr:hypothetical protein M011DRAFT_393842 [Sporormia fimetaria CBS 119925]